MTEEDWGTSEFQSPSEKYLLMLQADLKQEGKGQYFIREIPGPQKTVNTT